MSLEREAHEWAEKETTEAAGEPPKPLDLALKIGFGAALVALVAVNLADSFPSTTAVSATGLVAGGIAYWVYRAEQKRWRELYEQNRSQHRALQDRRRASGSD